MKTLDLPREGRNSNNGNPAMEAERRKNSLMRQKMYSTERRCQALEDKIKRLEVELTQKNELLEKISAKLIAKSRTAKRNLTKN